MEPYEAGLVKKNPYKSKRAVTGKMVAISDFKTKQRGLRLMHPFSRVVLAKGIHELAVTTEKSAKPGETVNNVAYLGFFEIDRGSVIVTDDDVVIKNVLLGKVCGFDNTHMPNHMTIVIKADQMFTGAEFGLEVEHGVMISRSRQTNST